MTKDLIAQIIPSEGILKYYITSYRIERHIASTKYIINPSSTKNKNTKSFSIYCDMNSSGWSWSSQDFETGLKGNCFDLVMKLQRLTFQEALERITNDFNNAEIEAEAKSYLSNNKKGLNNGK